MIPMAQQYDIKLQLAIEENNVNRVAEITGHSRNTITNPSLSVSNMVLQFTFVDHIIEAGRRVFKNKNKSVFIHRRKLKPAIFYHSFSDLCILAVIKCKSTNSLLTDCKREERSG